MTTPADTLLSRARAYLQNRAGRTALTVAPLATLGLAAAGSAQGDTAIFDPAAAFAYGNNGSQTDSNNIYFYDSSGGGLRGTSLGTNSAGVTGATFDTGTGGITFQDFEGGFAGTVGTVQIFSINGTGSGTLNPTNASAQIAYDFTLTANPGIGDAIQPRPAVSSSPFGPIFTSVTLALTVTTNAGTFYQNIDLGESGIYLGNAVIPVNGTTLLSYSAVLTAGYVVSPLGNQFESGFTVTIPAATSIDFTAVPEPSTWVILATGVAGAGLQVMRVRQRGARRVPTAA